MCTDHTDDDHKILSRYVGGVFPDDHINVYVDHIYTNQTCPEHGNLTDSGVVGIYISDETPGDTQQASAVLSAEDALLLADRLTRAAHLVLETDEDVADVEREYRRHSSGSTE